MQRLKKNWPLLLLVILSGIVYLTNLGGQDLSLDEPETWLLAKTVTMYGYPSAWDGRHLISIMNGTDATRIADRYLWSWHPWLQHYTAALSLFLFGESVAGIRMLFALAGVASIGVFYAITRTLFKNPGVRLLVTAQLLLLLPYFLYMRQARYYSLMTLFSLVILWALLRRRPWVVMGAGVLLALTNLLAWATTAVLIAGYGILKKDRSLLLGLIPQGLLVAGWDLFLHPYGNIFQFTSGWLAHFLSNVSYLNRYILPLWLLGLVLIAKRSPVMWVLLGWLGIKILSYSFLLVPHGRYLVDLFPILLLMMGYVYTYLFRKGLGWAAAGLCLCLILTNGIQELPYALVKPASAHFWWRSQQFATELLHHYPGAMPVLGQLVKQISPPGSLFWSNNYRLYLYLNSSVPDIAPVCDPATHRLGGPPSITDPAQLKTLVLFQHDTRLPNTVNSDACLTSIDQNQFSPFPVTIPSNTYMPNDPDIVNRQYPPIQATADAVKILVKNQHR